MLNKSQEQSSKKTERVEKIIAGVDYSMTCPCVCVHTGDKFSFKNCQFFFLTDKKRFDGTHFNVFHGEYFHNWSCDMDRYDSIADWAMTKLVGAEHVGLEGYAFAAKGKIFNIAENTGILKYKLWEKRIPVTIISPTEVKKMATGKGNADKEVMTRQFRIDTGVNLKKDLTPKSSKVINPVSDIVDSYYVCKELWYKTIDF
tara:strand:- start:1 stop:603 length:603 start_codon:yes stop_codon:yes gene_type:complete